MKGRHGKFVAAGAVAAVVMAVVPAIVVASILTNATAVAVKISTKLRANTDAVFTATSGPLMGLTTTCTASASTFNLTTQGGGLGPITISNPTFTGCSDNLGGTDTATSNSTSGPWTATYVNSTGSPNPDQIALGVPKAGQTLTSSAVTGCKVTVAPSSAITVSGSYNNAGSLAFNKATVTYSATGSCPTGTGTGNATFTTALKTGATGTAGYSVSPPVFGIH
jgi:hypothetical protein